MPIEVACPIRVLAKGDFHELAHQFMGVAFSVHNEFGRLMNERVYQRTIRSRCELAGLVPARSEIKIRAVHGSFEKVWFADLLVADGLLVEIKAVESLTPTHQAQTLNYLLLTGIKHGLLVNMRQPDVEKQFVSTTLGPQARHVVSVHEENWRAEHGASQKFRNHLLELVDDWGAFLELALYRDAMIHFFGGADAVLREIPVFDGALPVGTHRVAMIDDSTAFSITSLSGNLSRMESHLQRFLRHTPLDSIAWVNMHKHDIRFRMVTKS